MYIRRTTAVALALLTSAACSTFGRDPVVEVNAQDATLNTRWHANLASPASLAGAVQMRGSASMAPSADRSGTDVTLSLANASPGGLHPWAVHRGQCGEGMDDGVFGRSEAYQALEVAADGLADGAATVPLLTPRTGSYFVVIHASVANLETVVACGNLAPPTR
jgi:hypothetical protein